jgi:S-DNA-T family DNA segregation ATPase FtsK/SpoIIIE
VNKLNNKFARKNIITYLILLFNINMIILINVFFYFYNYLFNTNYHIFGNVGVYINYYLIEQGLGISIVIIPITYLMYIINIFFKKKINIKYIVLKSIISTLITSITFAYISNNNLLLSGLLAIKIINFIKLHIGDFGILLILSNSFVIIGWLKLHKHTKNDNINQNKNINFINKNTLFCKHDSINNFPKLSPDLLSTNHDKINNNISNNFKNKLKYILNHYNIKFHQIKTIISHSTILYEITPQIGTKISQIINLKNEIALYLSVNNIFINTSLFNKGIIGIEIPHNNNNKLYLKNIITSNIFINTKCDLPIILGQTIENNIVILDLIDMPHLLISGATGQGKSIMINSIIITLLYKKHPKELKFIMIDPKKVELSLYKNLSTFYLIKYYNNNKSEYIVTNTQQAVHIINDLCKEMYNRYNLLYKQMVKNIQEYNAIRNIIKIPYIILIIDEFADLMLNYKKQIEKNIIKLSQLSRAVGIHMIISTQRPSTNIITGLIKNNFIYRIAFKVGSNIDSRIILDRSGAEKLQGKGDMLLYNGCKLLKLQAPYIDTIDIKNINNYFIKIKNKINIKLIPEYVLCKK